LSYLELPFAAIIAAVLGLAVGSFLNVVIYRLPKMMEQEWRSDCHEFVGTPLPAHARLNLAVPRSYCPQCAHPIAWYENIPVLSYLALGGKCSACKAPIGIRYPAVELVSALFFSVAVVHFGASWVALAWCVFSALLIALFLIDLDTQLLPDDLNYLLLWLGISVALLGHGVALTSALYGAIFGYLSLWSVTKFYYLLSGKVGMGNGDFKLLAALGAWFGVEYLFVLILLSSLVGSVIGVLLLSSGRLADRNTPIAFGPFLAGAGLLAMLVGPDNLQQWAPFAFPLGGLRN
jgi:leader peptidase (prepilin peptidase)/N-methyltransferase